MSDESRMYRQTHLKSNDLHDFEVILSAHLYLELCMIRVRFWKVMKCLCSGEQLKADEMVLSSESLATKDYSTSIYSSEIGEAERKHDTGNIEEVESSLRESGSLSYEETRALLEDLSIKTDT